MENEYGILYFLVDFKNWDQILGQITPFHIYINESEDIKGYEYDPHLTLLYGLHENVKERDVDHIIENIEPFTIKITSISYFEQDTHDVLYLKVDLNNTLKKYRELAETLPFTSNHSNYNPHITICYMKKGTAKQYATALDANIVSISSLLFEDTSLKTYKYNL